MRSSASRRSAAKSAQIEALEIPLPKSISADEHFPAVIGQTRSRHCHCRSGRRPGFRRNSARRALARLLPVAMNSLARAELGGKLRCGGVTAEAFPSVDEVADFIVAARDANVAFKATAGLHHPVRHRDPASGFTMHGFLNLLAAAALAPRVDSQTLQRIVAEEDPNAFAFDDASFSWRNERIDIAELTRTRRDAFVAYGSCSFSEPVDDLSALGLLPVAMIARRRYDRRASRIVGTGCRGERLSRFKTCPSASSLPTAGCRASASRSATKLSTVTQRRRPGFSTNAASPNCCKRRCSIRCSQRDAPSGAALRERLSQLLRSDGDPRLREAGAEHFLLERGAVEMRVPMEIGDYVDFYSSIEHATNLGRLFRPNAEALLPNWRWIPVGYHGRSSTIVIDGTPVRRPCGQRKPPDAPAPEFGPSRPARHRAGDGLCHRARQPSWAIRSTSRMRANISSDSSSSTIGARATFRRGSISRSDRSSANRSRRRSRRGS